MIQYKATSKRFLVIICINGSSMPLFALYSKQITNTEKALKIIYDLILKSIQILILIRYSLYVGVNVGRIYIWQAAHIICVVF